VQNTRPNARLHPPAPSKYSQSPVLPEPRSVCPTAGDLAENSKRASTPLRNRRVFCQTLVQRVGKKSPNRRHRSRHVHASVRATSAPLTLRVADRQGAATRPDSGGKNCRIRADSQRQRQDRYEREARILRQHPQAVSHVLPERVQSSILQRLATSERTRSKASHADMSERRITLSPTFNPSQYLDRVYRASPHFTLTRNRFSSVIDNLENSDRARFLTVHRAAHEKHVLYVRESLRFHQRLNSGRRTIGQWMP